MAGGCVKPQTVRQWWYTSSSEAPTREGPVLETAPPTGHQAFQCTSLWGPFHSHNSWVCINWWLWYPEMWVCLFSIADVESISIGCFSLVFGARACKYTPSVVFGGTVYFRLPSTCCVSRVKGCLVSVTLQDPVSQTFPDASPSALPASSQSGKFQPSFLAHELL